MKQVLSFFFIFILGTAVCQEVLPLDSMQGTEGLAQQDSSNTHITDSLVNIAQSFEGVNYRYGGMSESGMDCSGLICKVFGTFNIKVPRSSAALSQQGEGIIADQLQKGDLLFFKGWSSNIVGHVAMVSRIEDGLIYMIHSSSSRGVIEEILQDSEYFMDRWLFNRRIIKD